MAKLSPRQEEVFQVANEADFSYIYKNWLEKMRGRLADANDYREMDSAIIGSLVREVTHLEYLKRYIYDSLKEVLNDKG